MSETIKTKFKITKKVFQNNDFFIFGASPIPPFPDSLKLNQYFCVTLKGELSYLSEGKEYELEVEELSTDKYGTSYRVVSAPSINMEELEHLTRERSQEILEEITTSSQANYVLDAYENFIWLALTKGKEAFDLSKIYNVGECRLNAYIRELNTKYKYLNIMNKLKEWKLDISDCKKLIEEYLDEEHIAKEIQSNPYKVLITTLGRSFEFADRMIMELRPDLKVSEIRCAYLILSVLERNEQEGSTRLNGNDLYYYIMEEYNVPELEPLIVSTAMNNDLFYYDEESKDLSIMSTYQGECKVADFVKDKITNSTQLNIDWTQYTTIDDFTMSEKQGKALEMFCKYNFMILAGYSGSGKAQPSDTVIPTPEGYKQLGDIKVGDYVYDRLGKPTKVLGVYPQGILDCYTVTLSDGRKTQCNDEHLWSYYTNKGNLCTKTLREMIDGGIKTKKFNKYKIPTNKAIEYNYKELPLDPYVLGSFIGNGCCKERALTISSNDEEQVKTIADILNVKYKRNHEKNYSWGFLRNDKYISPFNGHEVKYLHTKDILPKEICCDAYNKRIPAEYKYSSIEQRYALLQGLFDTDGYINNKAPRFNISYCTTSKLLANDIMEILRSLGYICSVIEDKRSLERKNIKNGHICYEIHLLCDNSEKEKFFRLARKKEIAIKAKEYKKNRNYNQISITNIEKENYQKEMVCIYVDNDEHLYLTNDYIVTHNTTSLKGLIKLMESNGMTYTLLAPTGKASRRITESVNRQASTIHRKVLRDGEISTDALIVDEMSMTDLPTFLMILNVVENPNIRIVLVGDPAQLMPVGIGCVFNDLINSGKVPIITLDEIFRYDTDGGIFVATNVRQGKKFFDNDIVKVHNNEYSVYNNYKFIQTDNIFDTIVEQYNKLLSKGVKPHDILCLSPFNVGDEGSYRINNAIQAEVNPPKPNETHLDRKVDKDKTTISFRVGDRLLNKKNDYQALPYDSWKKIEQSYNMLSSDDVPLTSVFNGQDGIIRELDDKKLVAQFDEELIVFDKTKLQNLLLAYCISVYSSQGSESKYVLNVVSPSHKRMLNRNLLYVADTRSKIMQIDIGDMATYNNALLVDGNAERDTWLCELMKEE